MDYILSLVSQRVAIYEYKIKVNFKSILNSPDDCVSQDY